MPKKVEKIKIHVTQKINLGNYETRDYSVGLEISGFKSESVQKAIDFGRELCLKETQDYYKSVKDEPLKTQTKKSKEYIELEKKIKSL